MRGLRLLWLVAAAACGNGERIQACPDNFVGVGLELTIQDDYPVVVRILPGGSAESAGVEPGDRVVLIEEQSTRGMTLGNAVMLIRGKAGSQVRLTIDGAPPGPPDSARGLSDFRC